MTAPRDTGAARGIVRPGQPAADAAAPTPEHVLAGAALIREGRMSRLPRERFPKMPLWPGHPTFEVVSYRTTLLGLVLTAHGVPDSPTCTRGTPAASQRVDLRPNGVTKASCASGRSDPSRGSTAAHRPTR
jgi:hypothetical protein